MMKLLSIVTVTFKDSIGFFNTINSISSILTDKEVELIVVDGGKDYSLDDFGPSWNVILISEDDSGIYDAMNKGIAYANSSYIWFLNGGDLALEPSNLLTYLQSTKEKSSVLFVYANYLLLRKHTYAKKAKGIDNIVNGMITSHQAMIYSTELIVSKKLRYRLDYSLISDLVFTYEYLNQLHDYNIKYFDEYLIAFDDNGASKNFVLGILEQFKWRKELKVALSRNLMICFRQLVGNVAKIILWR